jgi:transposase-like protein
MTHSTLTTKQQFWLGHIQAASASEDSMAAYAAQHNLSSKALYAWKSRLSHKKRVVKPKSDFTPLKLESEAKPVMGRVAEPPSCRVTLPTGARIEFMGDLTPATVRSILTLAGASR